MAELIVGVNEENGKKRILMGVSEDGVQQEPCSVDLKILGIWGGYWESASNHGFPPKSQRELEERFGYISVDAEVMRTAVLEREWLKGNNEEVEDILKRERVIKGGS